MKIEIKKRNVEVNTETFWAKWGLYVDEKEIGISATYEELLPLYNRLNNDNALVESLYNQFN